MLYYTADPRDGGPSGAVCNSCCCQTVALRPGETNLMLINFAPWSLSLGGPGIVPTMEYLIEVDDASCPSGLVEGFAQPTNTNYTVSTPLNTELDINLGANVAPAANQFVYKLVPLSGPSMGTIEQVGTSGSATFKYTPNNMFQGYDYFYYQMEDGQGRQLTRAVRISVGQHTAKQDPSKMALRPYIDPNAVSVLPHDQAVRFPIHMPVTVRGCETFRMTIKMPAKDCDGNLYYHMSCYDIRPKDC